MKAYRERLMPFLPGKSNAEKKRQFMVLFPAMAGVMMTARAMSDPADRKEILATARRFYTGAFVGQNTR
jgi:TetR/AcrR family transcriptional repressor of nem operon